MHFLVTQFIKITAEALSLSLSLSFTLRPNAVYTDLFLEGVQMVQIDVSITNCVHEFSRLQPCSFGHDVSQQRITCDIERNSQTLIRTCRSKWRMEGENGYGKRWTRLQLSHSFISWLTMSPDRWYSWQERRPSATWNWTKQWQGGRAIWGISVGQTIIKLSEWRDSPDWLTGNVPGTKNHSAIIWITFDLLKKVAELINSLALIIFIHSLVLSTKVPPLESIDWTKVSFFAISEP